MCLKLVCLVEHHKVVDITSACLPLYICLYIFIFPGRQGKQQTHIPVSFLISNIGQVAALMIGADKFIAGTLPRRNEIWNPPGLGERECGNVYSPIIMYNRDKGLRDLVLKLG